MVPTAPVPSRAWRGLAVAATTAVLLPLAAAPASAQTTTTTERAAATQASALRVTINLPMANRIQLDISTATGIVRSVTGSGPEAEAIATVLRGNVAGNAMDFPGAEARLPEPRETTGPTSALGDGFADSPLAEFLAVGLAESTASVTEAPGSTSSAQLANLGLGLPVALGDALGQVLDPLLAGLDELLTQAGPLDEATQAACMGLEPVTVPVGDGVGGIPVLGDVLMDVIDDTLTPEQGVLCNLRASLVELRDELEVQLEDLTGPGGLIDTGPISASQTISTEGDRTAATSTAQVANLQVLGRNPFGDVTALETTSTASLTGGTAEATVERTAVEAFAGPLLELDETDLDAITGDLVGIELDGLTEVLDQVRALLDALAGIGIQAGPLDDDGAALGACPDALDGQLTGTFEAPGTCAAAAARGFGLAVTLPEELATPLGIEGPLLAVQLAPSAAVVRTTAVAAVAQAVAPVAQGTLPRTGGEAPLAAAGLALLVGAALVRRRRSASSA